MQLQRILSSLVLATTLVGAPYIASATPAPIATVSAPATTSKAPKASDATDVARYAELEQQSPAAGTFEGGGSAIYIGGSALTLVLVILLIVIIL
jgi:hypothetical protein